MIVVFDQKYDNITHTHLHQAGVACIVCISYQQGVCVEMESLDRRRFLLYRCFLAFMFRNHHVCQPHGRRGRHI